MTEAQKKWEVVKFSVAEADIAKKKAIYMDLTVSGPDDDEGFKDVDTARKVMKADRVAVNNREDELKAPANAFRKKVIARAKELRALIEPIENHLKAQCKIVTDEQERLEKEADEAFQKKIDIRMDTLAGLNAPLPYQEVATMSDDDFHTVVTAAEMAWEDEQARVAEEKRLEAERQEKLEKEHKAEEERLEAIREEQEEAAAKIKAEQDKIDAEKADLQAEKDRIAKEAADKIAAEEARAQAEKDEAARIEREAEAAEEKKAAEAAEKEKLEFVEFHDDGTVHFVSAEYGGGDRKQHLLKLADAFFDNLEIDNCEYGGIGLNDKRPFGSSYVEGDILEIVGIEPVFVEQPSGEFSKEHNKAQEDYANDLYGDLIPFLQRKWELFREV